MKWYLFTLPLILAACSAKISNKNLKINNEIPTGLIVFKENVNEGLYLKDSARMKKIPVSYYNDHPFWADITEVTVKAYSAFLKDLKMGNLQRFDHPVQKILQEKGLRKRKDHIPANWNEKKWKVADYPVTMVDWFDAYAYCNWAGKRLPDKNEWLAASCSKKKLPIYPHGNVINVNTSNLLMFWIDKQTKKDKLEKAVQQLLQEKYAPLKKVGYTPDDSNIHGIMDMTGNVCEWLMPKEIKEHEKGGITGGASWKDAVEDAQISNALKFRKLTYTGNDVGFRCIK